MTLVQLQILIMVVEKGSFTLAAEAIGMTQSAVSHAIAGLEAELGVQLLKRDRTGIELNEIGREILQHAREIMQQAENIKQKTSAVRGLARGRIRIGTFPSTSVRLLPGVIREFQLNYPGIELALLEGTDHEVYGWIENGVVDLGFVTLPETGGLETIPVARDEQLVVMSERHQLSKKKKFTIRELSGEPFVMPVASRENTISALFAGENLPFHPKFEALGTATILAIVEENLGLTIIPEFTLPQKIKDQQIVTVPLDPPVWRQLAFGVRSVAQLPPAVKIFIEVAQRWSVQHGYLKME